MAHFFITRPIFAMVLSIVIVLLGGVAILVLPVAQFPPISPPLIQVQTTYIGASASVVEQSVASEIENKVVGVDNLIYMQSTSSSSGQYTLNCTFKVGADIQKALIDVQNRVTQATGTLPESVNRFGITVQKKSPQILMVVALYSPTNSYDRLFLSNYTTLNLINPLLSVPGIGGQSTIGEQKYAMRAWVRPDQLAKLGLQASDVANAISSQNVLIPTGAVGALPAPKNNQFQLSVNAQGRLTDPSQFGNIVVRSNPDGSILRLRDVSRVELGAQLYQTLGSLNEKPATLVILYQTPDANALTTAKAVEARMAELAKAFPPGLTYSVAYDSTLFVKDSIKDVLKTLFEALVLVIIVVFVFLGSFRSSFIPMLAVPVSLIGTFIAFLPLGFSVNTLTLFGLVLAIGIVVDDAIVVVEGVEHHIESGMEPLAATERAMKELTAPILGISLVLTSVFLPSAFISGIVGQLFRQFALDDHDLGQHFGDRRADADAGAVRADPPQTDETLGAVWMVHRQVQRRLCLGDLRIHGRAALAHAAHDSRDCAAGRLLRSRRAARKGTAGRLRAGRGSGRRVRSSSVAVRVVARPQRRALGPHGEGSEDGSRRCRRHLARRI